MPRLRIRDLTFGTLFRIYAVGALACVAITSLLSTLSALLFPSHIRHLFDMSASTFPSYCIVVSCYAVAAVVPTALIGTWIFFRMWSLLLPGAKPDAKA